MLAERLQRFEPFASADLAERTTIARHARLLELPAGRCFVAGARRAPGSWYLWRGAVRLRANDGAEVRVTHDCAAAKRPLIVERDSNVRAAATIVASTLLYVDVAPIAFLLERRALPVYAVNDVATADHSHWMHRFLSGGFARRLPPALLQTLFRSFEPLEASAGANVVRRGAPGDAFFVLRDGIARVATGQGNVELSPGTAFGADALVSGMMRNASVEMVTDGTLLALPAFRFRELIEDPLIERVTSPPRDAVHLDAGRLPRTPTELRCALARLDAGRTYAVSAVDVWRARLAVYLLGERDVDAVLLE